MKDLYSKDPARAISYLSEMKQQSDGFKNSLVSLWDRSVNFSNGNQSFNQGAGSTFTSDGQFSRGLGYNQRQNIYVTNEIEPIIRTLVSFMTRAKPAITAFASDDNDNSSLERARIAEQLMKAKYQLDEEQRNSRLCAYWALVLGSCFRKDYWDNSTGANYSLPKYDENGLEIRDKNGKVKVEYQKTGSNNVAILTPYSMDFDFSYTEFDEMPWIRENYLMDVDWVKENFYKKSVGYYTDNLEKLKGGDNAVGTLSYLENLKYSAASYGRGYRPSNGGQDKVLVSEIYIKPSSEYQRGRCLIIAGDKVIYDSPASVGSPYYMEYEDVMWHPYTMFVYEPWIGRFLGKGIVEQLLPLQMRLNEINGAILENANTLAKVDVLAAEGQLRRGILNGKGGNVFVYKPKPGVPAPVKWPGTPLPQQFFQERSNLIDAMVRIAGTNFVMQGQPPSGITAGSAIQQLLDNATSQQSDLMMTWEKFHEAGFTKKLRIIRNFNKIPDIKVLNYMRSISKDALDMDIRDFVGEDIGDGISVKIEQGSMIPKNAQLMRDQYKQFADMGLLGNLSDPSVNGEKMRSELLSKFGEKPLETGVSVEIEKARWENERIKKGLVVIVSEFDNDEIHMSEHTELFQSPKFIERSTEEMKKSLYEHMSIHKKRMEKRAQEMEAKQMQQMQMMEKFKSDLEIQKVLAQEGAEAKGEAGVEQIKNQGVASRNQTELMKKQMDEQGKAAREQQKAMMKIMDTKLKNEGVIKKEVAQADLAKDFLNQPSGDVIYQLEE